MKAAFPVSLLRNTMEETESVRNLDVILDADNPVQRHVANLCHLCYYHLTELRKVRKGYLTRCTAVKVASAVISSRLDYYNSTLPHKKDKYQ